MPAAVEPIADLETDEGLPINHPQGKLMKRDWEEEKLIKMKRLLYLKKERNDGGVMFREWIP